MQPSVNLFALSALLAQDQEAGRLSTRHLQMLALLCASDRPLRIGEIGLRLGLDAPATSRSVYRLAELGLAELDRSDEDRRIWFATPSKEGLALDARVRAHIETCRA